MTASAHYTPGMVSWRLGDLLNAHNITPYRLSEETRGKISRNAIYQISRGETKRVELDTLNDLIEALYRLTGKSYRVSDLLEYADDMPKSED